MKPACLALLILSPLSALASTAVPSYIFPDIHCRSEQGCAAQVSAELANYYRDFPTAPLAEKLPRHFLVPELYSMGHKTAFTFIFIHGLWDTGAQWDPVLQSMRAYRQNMINLVLPGHGLDHVNGNATTWQEWAASLDHAISAAKQMGDTVIILGQSTGAMVAFRQALSDPRIAALALLEPAFGINELYANRTCTAARLVPDAFNVKWMLDAMHMNMEDKASPLYVQLSCALTKLTNDGLAEKAREPAFKAVYAKLKQPIYILSNANDSVISKKRLRWFSEAVTAPHKLQEFKRVQKEDGTWTKMDHGTFTKYGFYNRTDVGPRPIEIFLEEHFPELKNSRR